MKAFGDVKKDEDFEKKFLKLIKNLDKESVDTLITIFNRIEKSTGRRKMFTWIYIHRKKRKSYVN